MNSPEKESVISGPKCCPRPHSTFTDSPIFAVKEILPKVTYSINIIGVFLPMKFKFGI